jgi:hypothetical protein
MASARCSRRLTHYDDEDSGRALGQLRLFPFELNEAVPPAETFSCISPCTGSRGEET